MKVSEAVHVALILTLKKSDQGGIESLIFIRFLITVGMKRRNQTKVGLKGGEGGGGV